MPTPAPSDMPAGAPRAHISALIITSRLCHALTPDRDGSGARPLLVEMPSRTAAISGRLKSEVGQSVRWPANSSVEACRRGPRRGMGVLNALQDEDSEQTEAEQGEDTADQPGLAAKCQFSSVVGSLVLIGHRSLLVEIRPGRRGERARRPPSRPRDQAGPSSGPVPLRGTCLSAQAPRRSPTPVRRERRRRCHHRS